MDIIDNDIDYEYDEHDDSYISNKKSEDDNDACILNRNYMNLCIYMFKMIKQQQFDDRLDCEVDIRLLLLQNLYICIVR